MKNLYKQYFTSDWHVGHKNVISFSNRPFKDLEHMHRVLINNYNNTVNPEDTCYFLGDMGLGNSSILKEVFSELHGNKILILGNHDNKGESFWRELGFTVLLSAKIKIGKTVLSMSHCPLAGIPRENCEGMKGAVTGENWHGEARHKEKFSYEDTGQFHLHGHIHSPNNGKSQKILGRQYDVGVDANDYRPVSCSTIQSWIAKTKQY